MIERMKYLGHLVVVVFCIINYCKCQSIDNIFAFSFSYDSSGTHGISMKMLYKKLYDPKNKYLLSPDSISEWVNMTLYLIPKHFKKPGYAFNENFSKDDIVEFSVKKKFDPVRVYSLSYPLFQTDPNVLPNRRNVWQEIQTLVSENIGKRLMTFIDTLLLYDIVYNLHDGVKSNAVSAWVLSSKSLDSNLISTKKVDSNYKLKRIHIYKTSREYLYTLDSLNFVDPRLSRTLQYLDTIAQNRNSLALTDSSIVISHNNIRKMILVEVSQPGDSLFVIPFRIEKRSVVPRMSSGIDTPSKYDTVYVRSGFPKTNSLYRSDTTLVIFNLEKRSVIPKMSNGTDTLSKYDTVYVPSGFPKTNSVFRSDTTLDIPKPGPGEQTVISKLLFTALSPLFIFILILI